MAQPSSVAQLKENVALLDAIRHQYAEGDDVRMAKAVESTLREASSSLMVANANAKDLIHSIDLHLPRERLFAIDFAGCFKAKRDVAGYLSCHKSFTCLFSFAA